MRQAEKTQITRDRILAAALEEFGQKSYADASVNSICALGHIPKGLFYHNYKSKDALYLECVKLCYHQMVAYMKERCPQSGDVKERLRQFLLIRQAFFEENPGFSNIFFNAVLQPPGHLVKDLTDLRTDFNGYLTQSYLQILQQLPLRKGVTPGMALEYFLGVCEVFNGYFRKQAEQAGDYHTLIHDHEDKLSWVFDVMLYGIAAQDSPD